MNKNSSAHIALTAVLVVMAIIIAYGIFLLQGISMKVQSLEANFQKAKSEKRINLKIPSFQKIDDIFYVAKLSVESHLTGIKINGVMINSTALEQKDIKFKISINDNTTEFTVDKISAGSGKKFEVVIPNIPIEKASEAQIQCLASSMSYYID